MSNFSPIVEDADANDYWWCACGKSNKQPFCDGSHKGSGIIPLKVEIKEQKKVAWCTCKKTNNAPFCDGTHRNI